MYFWIGKKWGWTKEVGVRAELRGTLVRAELRGTLVRALRHVKVRARTMVCSRYVHVPGLFIYIYERSTFMVR